MAVRIEGLGNLGATVAVLASSNNVVTTYPGFRLNRSMLNKHPISHRKPAPVAAMFNPAVDVSTCGTPGGVPCDQGDPGAAMTAGGFAGFGDLGRPGLISQFTCPEYESGLAQLRILLAEAERLGLAATIPYKQAKTFNDNEESWLTWPSDCDTVVPKISVLYNALNTAIMGAGGANGAGQITNSPPSSHDPSTGPSTTTAIIAVAIAVAALAGAVMIVPIVKEAILTKHALFPRTSRR